MDTRATEGAAQSVRAGTERRVVVLVDDDALYLAALQRLLRRHESSIEVAAFATAATGFAYVVQRTTALVVMDAYMPRTTGIEACRQLRAAGVASPVALMSAFMTPELEDEAFEAGATYAVPKPVDVLSLFEPATAIKVVEPLERSRLIEDHVGIARNIARGLVRRYGWLLEADDIDGSAMVGLCEAAERFDRTRAEPFLAFAERRIRGAVLDEVRRLGTHGRVISRRQRHISTARRTITASGDTASDDRVAEHLGLSVAMVRSAAVRTRRVSSDEAAALPSPETSPEAKLECAEFLVGLARALEALSGLESKVIRLRYQAGMSLACVARTLQLTLGRIRHIHAKGLAVLRDNMPQSANGDALPFASLGALDELERTARPK